MWMSPDFRMHPYTNAESLVQRHVLLAERRSLESRVSQGWVRGGSRVRQRRVEICSGVRQEWAGLCRAWQGVVA